MRKNRYQFKGVSCLEDISSVEEIPLKDREVPSSTYQAVLNSVDDNPDETALSFFMLGEDYRSPFTFSFREVLGHINQIANLLKKEGVGENDVVAMVLPNIPETCFSIIAAQTVGIVFPINPLLEPKQIKELLLASKAKILITIGPFVKTDVWEKVDAVRGEVPTLKKVFSINMSPYLLGWKKTVVGWVVSVKNRKIRNITSQPVVDFSLSYKREDAAQLSFEVSNDLYRVCTYFHTGGTTGRPKIAKQTQRNITFNAWSTGNNLDTSEEGLTMFGGLPLFHVFGAMITFSLVWSGNGHLVLVSPKGYRGEGVMENFWNIVKHYKVNFLAAVPAIYKQLNSLSFSEEQSESIRFAISGAAPMPIGVFEAFEKKTGVKMLEGYGCTEGACIVSVNPPYGERRIGSVGHPIPYSKIKVLELSGSKVIRECAPNEIGTVCFRGDHLFEGYLEEEHNENIWVGLEDGERWYNTGDQGRMDESGYLWLTGREKELIIRGGHNIDPRQIEEPFYNYEGVEIAAAVGRPDARVGEVPVLYVQPERKKELTVDELMRYAETSISERAAVPKEIVIVDKIPMTTIEKVYKPELAKLEIEKEYYKVLGANNITGEVKIVKNKLKGLVVEVCIRGKCSENQLLTLGSELEKYQYSFEIIS